MLRQLIHHSRGSGASSCIHGSRCQGASEQLGLAVQLGDML
jgi:hypothetical protein